jgi:hypothetical protein
VIYSAYKEEVGDLESLKSSLVDVMWLWMLCGWRYRNSIICRVSDDATVFFFLLGLWFSFFFPLGLSKPFLTVSSPALDGWHLARDIIKYYMSKVLLLKVTRYNMVTWLTIHGCQLCHIDHNYK